MAENLRDLIRQIIREEIEEARHESVSNRYKMVRVNNVLVPQAGKVYVVPVDNEATFPEIVVNRRVAAVEGLEVVVGVDNTSNVRQVLDIFDGEIFDQDDYTGQTFQPLHGDDHGWTSKPQPPFNNPAVDAVTIGSRGIYPLRARPAKGGGVAIDIAPYTYEYSGNWVVFPGADSYSLSGSVPGTSGQHRFTLVYLDKSNGQITLSNGSTGIYGKNIRPPFPVVPTGHIEPIALIRLYNGQTSIDEKFDIYDVRRLIGSTETDDLTIDGDLTVSRTSTWFTDLKNVNSSASPRFMIAGGNSSADTDYLLLVGDRYSDEATGIPAGLQLATSYDCADEVYRPNNYGLTVKVDDTAGLTTFNTFSQTSGNGGDIEFKQQDGSTILYLDDSAQQVGIGTITPSTRLDVSDGAIEFTEMTEPAAAAANDARLYSKDDGSGNTQLAARFSSGLVQVLATQSSYLPYKIPLSAMNFYLTEGTPSQGYIGASTQAAASSWLLADSANETVSAGVQYTGTESGSTITIDVYWAMESATTGDVALQVRGMSAFADGEDFTAAGTNNSKIVTVAGTAQTLTLESFAISESYVPDDIIRISIRRQGLHGSDTAAGDLHVIAAIAKFS